MESTDGVHLVRDSIAPTRKTTIQADHRYEVALLPARPCSSLSRVKSKDYLAQLVVPGTVRLTAALPVEQRFYHVFCRASGLLRIKPAWA